MLRATILIAAAVLMTACTTAQQISRPDGRTEYQIACGASLGWNICYDRANELCPAGWETVAQIPGFNRKELTIYCPAPTTLASGDGNG